jgi:hypothetical protein
MPIYSIYQDFYTFLEAAGTTEDDLWDLYKRFYFQPHRSFFRAYWSTFFPHMDLGGLQDRVRQIRCGHYTALRQLTGNGQAERIIADALSRCRKLLTDVPEPEVYLSIGFFSADGFIVDLDDHPVIGIGLERYRNFDLLGIILAHEYCHYTRRLARGPSVGSDVIVPGEKLLAEGMSVVFSRHVFPVHKLEDHLLMSRDRLSWCQRNRDRLESLLSQEMDPPCLIDILFGRGDPDAGIPPRTGMYLGYRLVERALQVRGEKGFEELLGLADIATALSSG